MIIKVTGPFHNDKTEEVVFIVLTENEPIPDKIENEIEDEIPF